MIKKDLLRTLREVPALLKAKKLLTPRPDDTSDCLGARVAQNAARLPRHSAFVCEGREMNWSQFNAEANRYAAVFKARGLRRGDVVSVLMENRIEFMVVIIALNKLGVIASLINTNLTHRPLVHCVGTANSSKFVFGEERLEAVAEVRTELALQEGDYLFVPDAGIVPCPEWAVDIAAEAATASSENPVETATVTLGDTAFYIFTSGTTGLPKAALLSNRRYLMTAGVVQVSGLQISENDRLYLCLPLYHGTGLMVGAGAAFLAGASMFIRRKFSASQFLPEVREYRTTAFVYIGELCRYLLHVPAMPDDADSPLRAVVGNGLRPDIWHPFKDRFGLQRVIEFYGSSEGNIGFVNLLNKDCTVGSSALPTALVQYDVDRDEVVRDGAGRCVRVSAGAPGLLLGKITAQTRFEGYTSSEATEKKILRDVFEAGDAWFNSGDLMRTVDVGFALGLPHYQFVDRIGDTFRWKGENVSTNEVGEILNQHPQVALSNVFGVEVPGTDGRAGMAALRLVEGVESLDLASFSAHVQAELPAYARPLFLRIQSELDTTGTFKLLKGDLRKQGFDPQQVADVLCVLKPGSDIYEPLDQQFHARIVAGEAGY
ncbi:MAG: long-chain-acyl-CoA synthetase [Haliea sp.]